MDTTTPEGNELLFFSSFLGSDNPETYFKETDRQRIAWEILEVTAYGKKKRAEIGMYGGVSTGQSIDIKHVEREISPLIDDIPFTDKDYMRTLGL